MKYPVGPKILWGVRVGVWRIWDFLVPIAIGISYFLIKEK